MKLSWIVVNNTVCNGFRYCFCLGTGANIFHDSHCGHLLCRTLTRRRWQLATTKPIISGKSVKKTRIFPELSERFYASWTNLKVAKLWVSIIPGNPVRNYKVFFPQKLRKEPEKNRNKVNFTTKVSTSSWKTTPNNSSLVQEDTCTLFRQ